MHRLLATMPQASLIAQLARRVTAAVFEVSRLVRRALLVSSDRLPALNAAEVRLHAGFPHPERLVDIEGVLPGSGRRRSWHLATLLLPARWAGSRPVSACMATGYATAAAQSP
jgi:hypothetical protein